MYKKIILICLLVIGCLLVGCKGINTDNKMSAEKPKDFNFIFKYGVNAKNQLNTIKGQYTKDMVTEPSITTDLILSDEEMQNIYLEMKNIDILSYPNTFRPKSNIMWSPFQTYSIKVIINGKEKSIDWKDQSASENKDAIKLRNLFNKIQEVIVGKEQYKKLPPAKGGYQ